MLNGSPTAASNPLQHVVSVSSVGLQPVQPIPSGFFRRGVAQRVVPFVVLRKPTPGNRLPVVDDTIPLTNTLTYTTDDSMCVYNVSMKSLPLNDDSSNRTAREAKLTTYLRC